MMQKTLWTILFYTLPLWALAQTKEVQQAGQTWLGYVNQTRLSNRWGLWMDGHLRTRDKVVHHLSQDLQRAGLTYYTGESTWLTAGYAHVNDYTGEGAKRLARPEHRPWQQVQWQTRYAWGSTTQRLRLEERWRHKVLNDSTLANGWGFSFRARYSLQFQVPLSPTTANRTPLSLVVQDEVMVSFGKQVVYNYFDQNRLFLGFHIPIAPQNVLQAGYMNLFRQLPAGNRFRMLHVARLYYNHSIDLRRKNNR